MKREENYTDSHSIKSSDANSAIDGKAANSSYRQGRWTIFEHVKFLEALRKNGKEWRKV
jgi:hypothetical protein